MIFTFLPLFTLKVEGQKHHALCVDTERKPISGVRDQYTTKSTIYLSLPKPVTDSKHCNHLFLLEVVLILPEKSCLK